MSVQFLNHITHLLRSYKNTSLWPKLWYWIPPFMNYLVHLFSNKQQFSEISETCVNITHLWPPLFLLQIDVWHFLYFKIQFAQNYWEQGLGQSLTTSLRATFYKTHTHSHTQAPNCLQNFTAVSFPQYSEIYQTNRRQYN